MRVIKAMIACLFIIGVAWVVQAEEVPENLIKNPDF